MRVLPEPGTPSIWPRALVLALAAGAVWPVLAQPGAASTPSTASAEAGASSAPNSTALSLRDLMALLFSANKDIQVRRGEALIARTGIDRADAASQPTASLSATNGLNRQPNTYEEALSRGQGADSFYERKGQDYAAGISQLAPTGAKVEVKASLSRFLTNINEKAAGRPPDAKDNRALWNLSVTQPLARDAGFAVTEARLRVAELDTAVAQHGQSETETSVAAEAATAYYELVLAQHRLQAGREKVATGKRLLREARALARQGRLSRSDVLEVENSLARFQAGLSEAVQGERERMNRLRTLVMLSAENAPPHWTASDPLPKASADLPSQADCFERALTMRHDFLAQKKAVEREGIQLMYAKNQALPRIDLVASMGRNGLAYSAGNAFDASTTSAYPTWNVGLQMSFPIGEGRQGRADIAAADLRKQNALTSLKALEVQIWNDIDSAFVLVTSSVERVTEWQGIAAREQQQLQLERQRFAAGRTDMKEILMREERAINARLTVLEQQMQYARARIVLDAAQGTLLERWPT